MLNFPRMMLLSIYTYLLVVSLASGGVDNGIGIGLCILFGVLSYKITGTKKTQYSEYGVPGETDKP